MVPNRIHGTSIFTYIWFIFMVDVGKYTIHGSYAVYTANWVINMLPSPPFLREPGNSISIKMVVNVDPCLLRAFRS